MIKLRRMRWVGHVAQMGKKRQKRPLEIPRHRWVNNIKMDLVDRMGWYGLDWSGAG
jgi:hypothetical protein